ncbi:MAG: hypothetical protein KKC68_05310 [Candidatus Thermoplasmatota archaeon]|nr:hypothetical protein [Candidatus Thermoplasmatota archaeon]
MSICLIIPILISGCLEEQTTPPISTTLETSLIDYPSILPDWQDGEYHDYDRTTNMLFELEEKYPNFVDVFSIGKSVLGKNIWCIRLTNENNTNQKYSCLIDGCIHGCEWETGEACLYLVEYLLINFDANKTITHIFNSSEIYIIPLVNPDGRQENVRWNDNGIDLNRNFDVDFGRLRGHTIRFGKLFGRIKIPYIQVGNFLETLLNRLNKELPFWGDYSNCGRHPFSEPESQAIKNLMKQNDFNNFSFYVNCHTAAHSVWIPWIVFKPPFKMTEQETNIFQYILNWVEKNTEYEPISVLIYKGKKVFISGSSQDWFYKEYRIPSFSFEILSEDYEMWMGQGKHDHLVHWMQTTLPFFIYLLVNIENLHNWETPDIQPPLPDGIPPTPLS